MNNIDSVFASALLGEKGRDVDVMVMTATPSREVCHDSLWRSRPFAA